MRIRGKKIIVVRNRRKEEAKKKKDRKEEQREDTKSDGKAWKREIRDERMGGEKEILTKKNKQKG